MGGTGSGRKARFVRVVEDPVADARSESLDRSPLFATLEDAERDKLDSILVVRVGPVREGTVGRIEPDQGVEEIGKRWGGGKYRVQGHNTDGKPMKGAFETIDIGGEPKFLSRQAELEYKRQLGNLAPTGGAEHTGPNGPTSLDIVSILSKQADVARAEADRRDAEREAQHRRDMERLREEAKLREEQRARDEERREKERRAEDERARKDDEARERREKQMYEEARRRDQEFYAQMSKSGAGQGATDTLLAGVKLAMELRESGGGADEPSITQQIVGALAALAGGAARAPTVEPKGAIPPAAAATAARPRVAAPAPAAGGDDEIVLAGALGRAARAAIAHLQKIGADPKAVFAGAFDHLQRLQPPPREVPEPAPASEPSPENSDDSEAQNAPNVTSEAKSATS